ncbi:MAG: DUF5715 family protein [Neomegalonema sp.]|nr:DUF5715 family protein [Neomegalonema sp.]
MSQHSQGFSTSRRRFLLGVTASLAAPAIARGDEAYEGDVVRTLNFVHHRTGERFQGVYWWTGVYLPEAKEKLDWTLRDVNLDIGRDMDPKLFDYLYAIQQRMGKNEIVITSAFRTETTNNKLRRVNGYAAKKSYHIKGQAVDFYSPTLSASRLGRIARGVKAGGVGRYKGHSFIHVDTGPVRSWYS